MANRPNVLFILTDDQRFDTIGALGNRQIHTPNLDRLCEAGTAFTNAHIPSGVVAAVCMPSRAMLNSGKTMFHLTDFGASIPPCDITMPENFLHNGYNTCGIGKWHNGTESYARSFNAGAEIFFGGMWDHWNVPTYDFDPTGKYENMVRSCTGAYFSNATEYHHANHAQVGVHSTDLFSGKAMEYLDRYDSQDPFYMYLAFMAPHDPRTMPEKYQNMYDPEKIELPENFQGVHFDYGIYDMRDEALEKYPRDPMKVRQHIADYYAMITHLDDRIGELIEKLKEKGMYDNTIIVFAGDNGLSVGQHGLMGKQCCYEHSIRVPLIMAGPGIPAGKVNDNFVYLLDIYPTLCALTGVPCPDSVEGKDFSALLTDPKASIRDTIYAAYADRIRAVKDHHYKLIEYRTSVYVPASGASGSATGSQAYEKINKVTQFYDLEKDPSETRNLADNPAFAQCIEEMRKLMIQYRDQWDELQDPVAKHFWELY